MTRKLLLAVAAAILPLIVLELALRGQRGWKNLHQAIAFRNLGSEPAPGPERRAKLWHLLRASAHPEILYELRPDLETRFLKKRVTTDASGFRVTAPSLDPASDSSCTLLGLGDSVMFGWGVADDETYLSRLLHQLRLQGSDIGWRAVNTAVPGYNLAIEVATLLDKGLELEPDLVVVGWTGNDLDLPSFLRPKPSALSVRRLFVREWLELRRAGSRRAPFDAPTVRTLLGASRPEAAAYVEALPAHLRRLVGRDAFERSMSTLAETSDRHAFEVLFLSARGRLPRAVRRRARSHGFETLEIRMPASEESDARWWVLSERDPHPSALAHQRIAEALASHLGSGLARRACLGTGSPG